MYSGIGILRTFGRCSLENYFVLECGEKHFCSFHSRKQNKRNTFKRDMYGTPTLSYVFRCVLCADVTSLCAVLLRLYRGILPLCVVYTQIYYLQTSLYALYFPLYHVLSLIYTVQVSVWRCSQNFVICGAFSCYLTFNAVLITDRKIMSCGCSLWSRRHVIICSSFAFISRHSPFMCGV